MNWTKASALAEIVSSIAILLTLVYLAIQTQQVATQTEQNTAAIIANSRQQSLDAEVALLLKATEYVAEGVGPDEAAEQRRALLYSAFFRIREVQWLQHRDGLLDSETWDSYLRQALIQISADPVARSLWERSSETGVFVPGFASAVNEALAEFSLPSAAE
jgi:sensor c-di-GMP phosphodiesterase-like protein